MSLYATRRHERLFTRHVYPIRRLCIHSDVMIDVRTWLYPFRRHVWLFRRLFYLR